MLLHLPLVFLRFLRCFLRVHHLSVLSRPPPPLSPTILSKSANRVSGNSGKLARTPYGRKMARAQRKFADAALVKTKELEAEIKTLRSRMSMEISGSGRSILGGEGGGTVETWTTAQVGDYLRGLTNGLAKYADVFVDAEINGEVSGRVQE